MLLGVSVTCTFQNLPDAMEPARCHAGECRADAGTPPSLPSRPSGIPVSQHCHDRAYSSIVMRFSDSSLTSFQQMPALGSTSPTQARPDSCCTPSPTSQSQMSCPTITPSLLTSSKWWDCHSSSVQSLGLGLPTMSPASLLSPRTWLLWMENLGSVWKMWPLWQKQRPR